MLDHFELGIQPAGLLGEKNYYVYHDQKILACDTHDRWRPILTPEWRQLGLTAAHTHYMGIFRERPGYAIEVMGAGPLPPGYSWKSLTHVLSEADEYYFFLAGRGAQLLEWYRSHKFCGSCGQPTILHERDQAMTCNTCQRSYYPRISPCIIVLVTRGEEILLAKGIRHKDGVYSALAGFVEPGETAEQAVLREVKEEVGISIENLVYQGSQPWPFPHQLMLSFSAEYKSGDIRIDGKEIIDARWWHYKDLPAHPIKETLSGQLIRGYIKKLDDKMMMNSTRTKGNSVRASMVNHLLKINKSFWNGRNRVPVDLARARISRLARFFPKPPASVEINELCIEGVDVLKLRSQNASLDKALLYLHGGAFIMGSPKSTHLDFLWRLSEATGYTVFAPDYRKAPEHPFPAGLEDSEVVFHWLSGQYRDIILAGDSAGGGLAVSLTLKLRNQNNPLPRKLIALSPWVDLTGRAKSIQTNMKEDVMLPGHLMPEVVELYLAGQDPEEPYASPVFGQFQQFPETLILVSDSEVLLDDARTLAARMARDGAKVTLNIWEKMPHVWPLFAHIMPEARSAIEDIGRFSKT
jgi:NAD+ diphosphatase